MDRDEALRIVALVTAARVERIITVLVIVVSALGAAVICDLVLG